MSPVAARQSPVVYGLVLAHPVATLIFTLWAIDGLLHCDDPGAECGLGFAIHLLFPAAVGVAVAAVVGILGLIVRPKARASARLFMAAPVVLTLVTLWWALGVTKR